MITALPLDLILTISRYLSFIFSHVVIHYIKLVSESQFSSFLFPNAIARYETCVPHLKYETLVGVYWVLCSLTTTVSFCGVLGESKTC